MFETLRRSTRDPSAYVRRSVANHLNDIAKDHPQIVEHWLRRHAQGASPERVALLRHASRTLVKQGHAGVMDHWGTGRALRGHATLRLSAAAVALGDTVELQVELVSTARHAQPLTVDYVLHRVKADGALTPKVFKGWTLELAAGQTRMLRRRHAMRRVTVRTYHPGRHRIVLRINGRDAAHADFELRQAADG